MTVYIAHAPADRAPAEALEAFLERRGQFVELDDGQTAQAPVEPSDVFVLALSNAFEFAKTRLRLEQRALDAWVENRLIIVKLHKGLAPVGLRDLPAIDASDEVERDARWAELAEAIRAKAGARSAGAPAKSGGAVAWLVLAAAIIPGLIATAAVASIWLVNRIGPRPGGWPELIAGIESFGARYGLPPALTPWLFALALLVMVAAIGAAVAKLLPRTRAKPQPTQQTGGAVLVCATADAEAMPLIEAAKAHGRTLRLDKAPGAGTVRSAASVMVICSRAAFESDQVKRAVYLADRYRKRLIPVYIEEAAPPEDFAYFFAGVTPLRLFETPEADRPQALVAALG